jgi:hypothetical protein
MTVTESIQHQLLVKKLFKAFLDVVPSDCRGLIQKDCSESRSLPPPTSQGYRPDMYYCFNRLLIIGEAKTGKDVSRQHSRNQYEAYIKECLCFQGRAYLFLAVPWLEEAEANNILRSFRNTHPGDYKTKVIAWIDGEV